MTTWDQRPGSRQAILMLTADSLREGLGPLYDAGLEVVRSCASVNGQVELVIQGELLPEECFPQHPPRTVEVHFSSEAYGRQRITRVSSVEVVG